MGEGGSELRRALVASHAAERMEPQCKVDDRRSYKRQTAGGALKQAHRRALGPERDRGQAQEERFVTPQAQEVAGGRKRQKEPARAAGFAQSASPRDQGGEPEQRRKH